MTAKLPDPLTPPDCDLRDFKFMPLDVVRLRDSDTAAIENAEAFRCCVLLWAAAWHQVPAASLPNNDGALARLAGLGRNVEQWRALKEDALRGFVLCSDGRLYHKVVAEKAREAWAGKRLKSESGKAGARARWGETKTPRKQRPRRQPHSDAIASDGAAIDLPMAKNSKGQGTGDRGQGQGIVRGKERALLISNLKKQKLPIAPGAFDDPAPLFALVEAANGKAPPSWQDVEQAVEAVALKCKRAGDQLQTFNHPRIAVMAHRIRKDRTEGVYGKLGKADAGGKRRRPGGLVGAVMRDLDKGGADS